VLTNKFIGDKNVMEEQEMTFSLGAT